jgi:hypothetical protein
MKKLHISHCLIAVAAVAFIVVLVGEASWLPFAALVLVCPLMMFVMMRMMMPGDHDDSGQEHHDGHHPIAHR